MPFPKLPSALQSVHPTILLSGSRMSPGNDTEERLERRLWLTVYGVVAVILAQALQSFLVATP